MGVAAALAAGLVPSALAAAPARDVALTAWSVASGTPLPASRQQHASASSSCDPARPVHEHPLTRPTWLRSVEITEYYSTPERWFDGRRVRVPGLTGRHRVDWLYSAKGVSMEGDGIDLRGRHVHIDALGHAGWFNAAGRRTRPGHCASHWSHGFPAWLEGGWRNARGEITYPLERGGWSNGAARGGARGYAGVTFAPGSSLPLHEYRTVAVDPQLIPLGSRLYIPYYRRINGGWFVARDTGGAIIARHVDVYRPPPIDAQGGGRYLRDQPVYVVPPRP